MTRAKIEYFDSDGRQLNSVKTEVLIQSFYFHQTLSWCKMADKKIANELSTDYQLIGIAASLKEYKLCYHLNNLLAADFKKLPDLIFEPKDRTRQIQFSVFKSGEEEDRIRFMVFGNKNLNEVLLPEISNFDFILQINGRAEAEEIKAIVDGIKEFPGVMLTSEIPIKKIKSKERLVYHEEKPVSKTTGTKRFNRI